MLEVIWFSIYSFILVEGVRFLRFLGVVFLF